MKTNSRRNVKPDFEKIKKFALYKDNLLKIKGGGGGQWVLIDGELIWVPNP
ncbi:MAG: hypothetical protein LBU57_02475 [Dysgonamonadaceae bacterium]|jgi:hypothetical protein|nr:hypothetical protein [Dysgonamonadaceae bacterium]